MMRSGLFILSLILASVLALPIVSQESYTKSNNSSTSCNLKVLIQLTLLGDKRVSDNDQEINGRYWYYDLEQAVYRLIDKLKSITNCNVHVDWQFRDTAKPRHWWTPEYGGDLEEVNLVSAYDLVIFIGHGNASLIAFNTKDAPSHGGESRDYVEFKPVLIGRSIVAESHIRHRSWLILIGCNLFKPRIITTINSSIYSGSLYTLESIQYTLFENATFDPNNLSSVYLMGILGYESTFPYIEEWRIPVVEATLTANLVLDDYISLLTLYLLGDQTEFYRYGIQYEYYLPRTCRTPKSEGFNIVDAWFCSNEKFVHTLSTTIQPVAFYILIIDKRTHTIIYDPNKSILKLYSLKTPREIYQYYRNNGLLKYLEIRWVYAKSLNDIYGFYYLGGGSKHHYSLTHGRGGGGSLWGIRLMSRRTLIM